MRSLLTSVIPIELFLCDNCQSEEQPKHSIEKGVSNIIYDVVVASENEVLTVPVDIKELQYSSTSMDGVFDVYAIAVVSCPCCDTSRLLRYKTQAPRLLISDTPCPDCGGRMRFKAGSVSIDENDEINIKGKLICRKCSQVHLFKCASFEMTNDKLYVSAEQVVIIHVSGDYLTDDATKYDFGSNNTYDEVKIQRDQK
jgi:uncharacterized protein YbaR (Trm112 family)